MLNGITFKNLFAVLKSCLLKLYSNYCPVIMLKMSVLELIGLVKICLLKTMLHNTEVPKKAKLIKIFLLKMLN